MRIPDCPKNLASCTKMCPMYKCWALEKYEVQKEKDDTRKDEGWE